MKICLKCVLKGTLLLFIVLVLIVVGYVLYVIVDYERIADNEDLTIKAAISESAESKIQTEEGKVPLGKELKITTYNIGFGAYSHDFSFFMDGGKYARAIDKDHVLDDVEGAIDTIKKEDTDFALFQEVDFDSTRSYHVNEESMIEKAFDEYEKAFAVNYHSAFLFYPITEPHGKSNSGISTFSKYRIESSIRRKLPISTAFPDKFFDLDRCYSVTKIPTTLDDKMLCIYNVHLSAYTDDDSIRTEQLEMLMRDIKSEYMKGNYVICGGDFNHDVLGNSNEVFKNGDGEFNWAQPFPVEVVPVGFYMPLRELTDEQVSALVPTCRNTDKEYKRGENESWILDTFIVSKNIDVKSYDNIDADFKYSDHNPVKMTFVLRSEE